MIIKSKKAVAVADTKRKQEVRIVKLAVKLAEIEAVVVQGELVPIVDVVPMYRKYKELTHSYNVSKGALTGLKQELNRVKLLKEQNTVESLESKINHKDSQIFGTITNINLVKGTFLYMAQQEGIEEMLPTEFVDELRSQGLLLLRAVNSGNEAVNASLRLIELQQEMFSYIVDYVRDTKVIEFEENCTILSKEQKDVYITVLKVQKYLDIMSKVDKKTGYYIIQDSMLTKIVNNVEARGVAEYIAQQEKYLLVHIESLGVARNKLNEINNFKASDIVNLKDQIKEYEGNIAKFRNSVSYLYKVLNCWGEQAGIPKSRVVYYGVSETGKRTKASKYTYDFMAEGNPFELAVGHIEDVYRHKHSKSSVRARGAK